jgi:hypothetical protein
MLRVSWRHGAISLIIPANASAEKRVMQKGGAPLPGVWGCPPALSSFGGRGAWRGGEPVHRRATRGANRSVEKSLAPPTGLEPVPPASEAGALSD